MTPQVSVVTIFLNAKTFLEEAVASLYEQSLSSWELLLVDDGSTDGSTAIARHLAERDPSRVRYLEHPGHVNRGMSASRNLGIRHAQGRYLTFLDSDDVLLPKTLEEASSILDSHDEAGTVYAATLYWYSWTGQRDDLGRDATDFGPDRGVPPGTLARPPELLNRFLADPGSVPCMCSLVARRSVVEAVGGFEESFRGLYEDQVYYAKLALAAPVLVDGRTWSKYRQHPNSCCAEGSAANQLEQARSRYLDWLSGYLDALDIRHVDVWESVDCERRLNDNHRRAIRQREPGILGEILRKTIPATIRGRLQPILNRSSWFSSVHAVDGRSRTGTPIDRYYTGVFLAAHAPDMRGRVLEIGDGAAYQVLKADPAAVRDVRPAANEWELAGILENLDRDSDLALDSFECVILPQALHLVYDIQAALRALYRRLKPGGVLLATVPGIRARRDHERIAPCFWGFTARSAYRAFAETFHFKDIRVTTYGNLSSATAALQGAPAEQIPQSVLDATDPGYEVLIAIRAVKDGSHPKSS